MTESPKAESARTRGGFTLIEIIAVVAIIAMVFAIGIPRLGNSAWDPLEDAAENIAQSLRYARARAIMTGVPHRVLLDLEEGGYLIEWYVMEEDGDSGNLAQAFSLAQGGGDDGDGPLIELVPPERAAADYYPVPHSQMGRFQWLDDALYFVGVEGPGGWVEGGDYSIVFYEDGTTDPSELEIADFEDHRVTLEIESLLQHVRVRKGGARS